MKALRRGFNLSITYYGSSYWAYPSIGKSSTFMSY